MQKAEIVLSMLGQKSKRKEKENQDYVFDRLYRNLFNPDFYLYAYNQIFSKQQASLSGRLQTGEVFAKTIETIIEKMRRETFWPESVCASGSYSGKIEDILVKAILSFILEAVYHDLVQDYYFGREFKIHKILKEIKTSCQNKNLVITGEITNFSGNINSETVNTLLTKKITDGRYLELLRRFIKAGHLKYEKNSQLKSALPQQWRQGDLRNIICDIYLREFDLFIDKLNYSLCSRNTHKEHNKIKYFRYMNHFAIFLVNDRELAEKISKKIGRYLETDLKVGLSEGKTANPVVANLSYQRVKFIGYEIAKSKRENILAKSNLPKRTVGTIQLLVPNSVIFEKLKPFRKNNKAAAYSARINLPVSQIIGLYNAEIEELSNYYSLAADATKKIGKFKFYHNYSLAKTIACKEKTSVKKVIGKYGISAIRLLT